MFSTKKHPLEILRIFFRWCTEVAGYLGSNPAGKVVVPKSGHRILTITREEKVSIRKMTKCPTRQAILFLELTGCRPGEMRSLTWGQLQNVNNTFPTDEELTGGESFFLLTEFKGRKRRQHQAAVRIIPVCKRLGRMLLRMKCTRQNQEGVVFLNTLGKPWTISALRLVFRRARDRFPGKSKSRLQGLVAYTLRHTRATELARKGVSDSLLAAYLGHAGTDLVSWYVHPQTVDLIKLSELQ